MLDEKLVGLITFPLVSRTSITPALSGSRMRGVYHLLIIRKSTNEQTALYK